MSYSVAVEFRDTNADGQQEAIISRYNNGYAKNLRDLLHVCVGAAQRFWLFKD